MEDHYSTLGVAENASQDEIKSAYRKLAMQYHPDKNQGNAEAEEKFKRINAAYAELGEPDSRARYDQMRKFGGQAGPNQFHQQGFNFNFGFGGGSIDDIIQQFFSQHGFHHANRQARNRDFTFQLHLTLEEAFTGKKTPVHFNVDGRDYNLNVDIPPGVESGTRIRYQGHGDNSIPNVPPGDLYIHIQVVEHTVFKRNGPNLFTELKVNALDAIVGSDYEITCIDGQKVKLTIPPGTQHGTNLRLRERGMPQGRFGQSRGDCIVQIQIEIPTNLNTISKNKIKEVRAQTIT